MADRKDQNLTPVSAPLLALGGTSALSAVAGADSPGEIARVLGRLGFKWCFWQSWETETVVTWDAMPKGFLEHYYGVQADRFCPVAVGIRRRWQDFTFSEARRQLAGLHARDAERVWEAFGVTDGAVLFGGRGQNVSALILTSDKPVESAFMRFRAALSIAAVRMDELLRDQPGLNRIAREFVNLALLAEGPAREPAALRGRRVTVTARRHRGRRRLGPDRPNPTRDRLPPGARADAGLHRRARRRRPRRDARRDEALGGDPTDQPARHRSTWSSTTRSWSTSSARPTRFEATSSIEFERNGERYEFLRWGQNAFDNFRVVPPGTGIVHQVNLEYLARVVFGQGRATARPVAYPDTLVGTDSHTTMINGLGVLGWGVGGIEAEAAMLGQPVSMLIPEVVGFKLTGKLPEGVHRDRPGADRHRDAAREGRGRQVRRVLRRRPRRPAAADRATIANMAPEYGATCGFFPIDDETLAT
jgi:hypothetical protein